MLGHILTLTFLHCMPTPLPTDTTRGHQFKLFKYRWRLNCRLEVFIFFNRVINDWNNLPDTVVKATPNKFPVSRPPPASISSEHQKFHYFRILSLFPCFLVYSGV